METCELFKMIPKEKLDYLFEHSQASGDMDCTFLGFEEVYKSVLSFVPKSKVIIDFGCAYATQSYYFRDYKKYIGVDVDMTEDSVIHTENSDYYHMSIQDFINYAYKEFGYEQCEVFAICSYVPDETARKLVRETFENCLVYYPANERWTDEICLH